MEHHDLPRVGLGLPVLGPHASPSNVARIATTADRLGFHCLSVSERLLLPAHEGWTNEFGLPEHAAYDSLETLTWVAARTERVRVRTDVIVPLYQQPVVLARRLATIDHLSGGRLDVGIGLGWLPEEFAATGVGHLSLADRAAAYEEHIAALRACWGPDPVSFDGRYVRIPPSRIGPKPSRPEGIRLDGGGLAPSAIRRVARLCDGLTIGFRNWSQTLQHIAWYRDAGGAGPVVVKAGPLLTDVWDEGGTPPWGEATLVDDLARARAEGIDEVVWDPNIVGMDPDHQVEVLERLAAAALRGGRPAGPG